jgi:hypothetical protein
LQRARLGAKAAYILGQASTRSPSKFWKVFDGDFR